MKFFNRNNESTPEIRVGSAVELTDGRTGVVINDNRRYGFESYGVRIDGAPRTRNLIEVPRSKVIGRTTDVNNEGS